MADKSGMAEIRGIDIDKLAKGFSDEETVFKAHVTTTPTIAREIRWYQKTAGFLSSTTTAGVTGSTIKNVAQLARPTVVEQSWTRNTSYVKKYFVESPTLSDEDIRDSDVDILATNVRDLTRAVEYQIDARIWNVLTQDRLLASQTINMVTCSGTWNNASPSLANPIQDILDAKRLLRVSAYNPEGATLFLSPMDHRSLLNWLIGYKGSSIPAFSSGKMGNGVVQEILGVNVVVSQNVTSGFGCLAQGKRACTWKTFVPITARNVEDVGIGTKIRIWEEGEAILTDPKAVCLLSGTYT